MGAAVLVVGSGGREHALGAAMNASSDVGSIVFVPGNAGTAELSKGSNQAIEHEGLAAYATRENINLVVIGPEAPAVAGLGDELRAAGLTVFSASREAARLESSKAFATEFMIENGIPLPPSKIVTRKRAALLAIETFGGPQKAVIKADGLAGGKGVFLPDDPVTATEAIEKILHGDVDGDGKRLVIQQRYHGPEVSIFALCDGVNFKLIPVSTQDHKRLLNGDKGPNTGGMGVYAPLPDWMLGSDKWAKIENIAAKTVAGMQNRKTPYQGVLYIGLMLAEELGGEPVVIEYNARFGDPETEVLLPILMKNGVDIYGMLHATASGALKTFPLPSKIGGSAITICLAAAGYPENPQSGAIIEGLGKIYPNVEVFHGGTKQVDGRTLAVGGRVLYVTGFGNTLAVASAAANAAIGQNGIHFEGMQYRTDIGYRAMR